MKIAFVSSHKSGEIAGLHSEVANELKNNGFELRERFCGFVANFDGYLSDPSEL
ncbi:hypothetical protein [Ruegeria sp. SCP11]|uniref:hypothetical protein n=1 Tax=Ruegeria sp. SCP11 TaxID=3141378 RepID=UPI00333AE1FF